MQEKTQGKEISRGAYYLAFIITGIILFIAGFLWMPFSPNDVYDLPKLIAGLGVIFFVYGVYGIIMQILRRSSTYEPIVFSKKTVKEFLSTNAIILALMVLIVIICIQEHAFMQTRVLFDILTISSPKLIIALGICFTLLIAGTDLSAGRMVGLSAVISASMLQTAEYGNRFFPDMGQINIVIPIVLAILACMIFGVLNGYLVARYDMHPFIATLAVQVIIYGVCSLYFDMSPNNSQPIGGIRPDFAIIGQAKFFTNIWGSKFPGISILIPIAAVVCIIIWFILNKTVFGKNVYAIGGNREAAVVSGVNVFRTIIMIFVLASALYGIGGVLEAARTAGATNNYGNGYELDAIAACVVGGVSLNGGVGKVRGILTGVLIFSVIQYGLQFINVSPMWQQVLKGIIIAIAVAIDLAKYRRK